MKPRLTETDFIRAAERLRCEVPAIKAVAQVESRGAGFYGDGFPVILFERHIFRRETKGKYTRTHPHLSGPAGNYGPAGKNQRVKFSQAFALDADAAMKSCSWGKFQIMGFNHKICGFATVDAFVDAMKQDEGKHLDAFVAFVISQRLDRPLREKAWTDFARGYNGKGYAKNKYDTKMAAAYRKFVNEAIEEPSSINSAVASLSSEHKGETSLNPQEAANAPPIVPPMGDAPPSLVAVQTPVVEVEQVKPEQEDTIDKTISKWSARFVAVPAAALSFLGGVWSWLTSSDVRITITLIVAGSTVAALYFGIRMIMNSRDKARQDKLQAEREQRAHELQIMTLQSAMNKDLNTVRIVPQPIANSDNPANAEAKQ